MVGAAARFVVEEVKATAEAEGVVVWFVEGLALGLGPEVLWVLWNGRSWRGGRRVVEERVGFHLAEFGGSESRSPRGEREGSMAAFVNGYSDAVEHYSLAVPGFSRCHQMRGKVMEAGSGSGKGVGLPVELFCDGADEA